MEAEREQVRIEVGGDRERGKERREVKGEAGEGEKRNGEEGENEKRRRERGEVWGERE